MTEQTLSIPDTQTETAPMLGKSIDSLLETLEIINDDALMDSLRQGTEDIKAGRFVAWEDVKKGLRLE